MLKTLLNVNRAKGVTEWRFVREIYHKDVPFFISELFVNWQL